MLQTTMYMYIYIYIYINIHIPDTRHQPMRVRGRGSPGSGPLLSAGPTCWRAGPLRRAAPPRRPAIHRLHTG